MKNSCLLTSFQTWLPHQRSNSSDDLLEEISKRAAQSANAKKEISDLSLSFLRQLPVDINLASDRVIEAIERENFSTIICCGMAENRHNLTIESNANSNEEQFYTSVDLEHLVKDLAFTRIGHHAGRFVCEGLYFQILKYLKTRQLSSSCIFVHVPILTPDNRDKIYLDFIEIIRRINQ